MNGEALEILLVEDNPAHAKLVIRGLKDHKIANNINHVSDGEQALDYLYRKNQFIDPVTSPTPHVILLDLRMPKIDGLEVLKRVKRDPNLKSIPVVILTTSEAETDITTAYEYNANAYLAKPVEFDVFMKLMNDLGFFWLCWNQTKKM